VTKISSGAGEQKLSSPEKMISITVSSYPESVTEISLSGEGDEKSSFPEKVMEH
jgi:hypothetical protein